MNFGPVTPESMKVKDVHPIVSVFKSFRQIVSGYIGPIFTKFSTYGRYFTVLLLI